MRAFTVFVSALAMAASASAAPSPASDSQNKPAIAKRQAHPVDFEEACRRFKPAGNECSFITAGGVSLEWSGKNLGWGSEERVAVLLNSDCSIHDAKEFEPAGGLNGFNAQFLVRMDSGSATDFETYDMHTNTIGELLGVSDPTIKLNGNDVAYMTCGDMDWMGGVLSQGFFKGCNFHECII